MPVILVHRKAKLGRATSPGYRERRGKAWAPLGVGEGLGYTGSWGRPGLHGDSRGRPPHPFLLHLLESRLRRRALVQAAPLLLLVLLTRPHGLQQLGLVFVLFLLLPGGEGAGKWPEPGVGPRGQTAGSRASPLRHAELRDAFQLQGALLDLLVRLHGARPPLAKPPHTSCL